MDTDEYTRVNRLEVIDHTKDFEKGGGRAYIKWEDYEFGVHLQHQDNGRTLKIFLSRKEKL